MLLFNVLVYLISYLTKCGPGAFHVLSFKSPVLFALGFYKHGGYPKASLQPILDAVWPLNLHNNCLLCFCVMLCLCVSVKFPCWGFHSFLMKGFVKI